MPEALATDPKPESTSLAGGRTLIAGCPDGLDALHLVGQLQSGALEDVVYVGRDVARCTRLIDLARIFAPETEIVFLPAWDCMPYDRVSPNGDIMARRLEALGNLTRPAGAPRLIVTSVNALVQRMPAPAVIEAGMFRLKAGDRLDREALLRYLDSNGYRRTGTVVEAGEYAVRGGIIDLFPNGAEQPVRLDLFGDVLEGMRGFDPLSQRSLERVGRVELRPVSEVTLDAASIERFRVRYLQRFGAIAGDPLFDSVTAGRTFAGMEHWLPLFQEELASLFDYLQPGTVIALDHLADETVAARLATIGENHEARLAPPVASLGTAAAAYRALPPEMLYLSEQALDAAMRALPVWQLSPYSQPDESSRKVIDLGGRLAREFTPERGRRDVNLFDAVIGHIGEETKAGRRVIVTAHTAGAAERLKAVIADHGFELVPVATWLEARTVAQPCLIVLPLEHGFVSGSLSLLGEQDILGERLIRPAKRRKRADKYLADLTALSDGDYVVHSDHGIGQYDGLITLEIAGAPHDCIRLLYQGGDKLFLPVENLDLLSRYGAAEGTVQLDKLGGLGWQARKAKVKQRVEEIADDLMKTAAARTLKRAPVLEAPSGLYDEFRALFPFEETDDQAYAIEACLDDLASGHAMDRLVCGDVGFGKTEVALRAAFAAAASGKQVALLAPTTLLVRQHFQRFQERFAPFGLKVEQLSRFVPAKRAREIKEEIKKGEVSVAIGTHALIAKDVDFRDLGLVIIDEEQHFGVTHKERMKQLRAEVHVLTLTATPIPRTLQMALGGLKDMSIIATPPVDRLAVRSFVMPADPVVLREAILREHYRGGQSFYVTPRIEDQVRLAEDLHKLVPEVRIAVANGRMPARQLEEVMGAFYDRQVDVLLATNIIESGLDIPSANTMIIHRADLFGLSQLYQLRGRIGRSKVRGYAYFTMPPNRLIGDVAERRLSVIQSLEGLGAGFQLASHDLDIRGAGNLLGSEQSGQIKEVGYELYNHMLEEAVAAARAAGQGEGAAPAADWTPQITVDAAALIPDDYIGDLDLRLSMYRRLASLRTSDELESFAAELIDRFGSLPEPTEQLLQLIGIKQLCRTAGVAKVEAGPKGIVAAFHGNSFAYPERLIRFLSDTKRPVRLRPDHKLAMMQETKTPKERLKLIRRLVGELAELAA
ncbi:transcription-repair coupling factor [Marinivivus vitaminiproducens]|uniref:transcription-repair coupling factor n=1 Tax=Marinivivus vitaminiproducens TaxID=3035935 RepID=UPI0027A90C31|nr:transcription-repair coupling factor [Geminicoccaceae bacterium SCSIO 64248]